MTVNAIHEACLGAGNPSTSMNPNPIGWNAAKALIGFIDDAPADTAKQYDNRFRATR